MVQGGGGFSHKHGALFIGRSTGSTGQKHACIWHSRTHRAHRGLSKSLDQTLQPQRFGGVSGVHAAPENLNLNSEKLLGPGLP